MARTARQRAALRKAQLASARKRKGKGRSRAKKYAKRAAIGYGVAAAGSAAFGYYLGTQISPNRSKARQFGEAGVIGIKLPAIIAGVTVKKGMSAGYKKMRKR